MDAGDYAATKDPHSEARIRAARRASYAMLSYVDSKIGEMLKTLEEEGLYDDTIVVLTSDHGDMLGERGMWFKVGGRGRRSSVGGMWWTGGGDGRVFQECASVGSGGGKVGEGETEQEVSRNSAGAMSSGHLELCLWEAECESRKCPDQLVFSTKTLGSQ